MKIINPLYDKAFKYLMENDKFAKKVLSVILDVTVEEVKLENQETVLPYAFATQKLTLFRLDFKAKIKEADGTRKTVLIELQKSKFSTDIQRFRNYLGANYIAKPKENSQVEEPVVEYESPFPIITIYILGYNLEDLPYMAVTVSSTSLRHQRDIINAVSKERIQVKSFFIEHLTHQSHIIQIRRLPEKRRTRLEKFLVLFNQAWCTDEGYIIDLQEVPKEFIDIANYLQSPLMDDTFRRNLEAEEQLDYIFGQQEAKFLRKISEAEKREQEAEKRELFERNQKEEERSKKLILAKELAILLKQMGVSAEKIAEKTGLSESEIGML